MEHLHWPEFDYPSSKPTLNTLKSWLGWVGKIRSDLTPPLNHSWQSTLYVSSMGLTTSLIPYPLCPFTIELDFTYHRLDIQTVDGGYREFRLQGESFDRFRERILKDLAEFNIAPSMIQNPEPAPMDYDPATAFQVWQLWVRAHRVLTDFRSLYLGKCSPVHLYWESLDLDCTRFSGRPVSGIPQETRDHEDLITKEAHSHEFSSCGFSPGNDLLPFPYFYAHAYPEPAHYRDLKRTMPASYEDSINAFILPLKKIQHLDTSDSLLHAFFQATYEQAANLGGWDRPSLEQSPLLSRLRAEKEAH